MSDKRMCLHVRQYHKVERTVLTWLHTANGVVLALTTDEVRWLRGACDRALSAIEYGVDVTVPYEAPPKGNA